MLVLTRKPGQELFIGNVRVVFGKISGGRVKVSIESPGDVHIRRGELKPLQSGIPIPNRPPVAEAACEEQEEV